LGAGALDEIKGAAGPVHERWSDVVSQVVARLRVTASPQARAIAALEGARATRTAQSGQELGAERKYFSIGDPGQHVCGLLVPSIEADRLAEQARRDHDQAPARGPGQGADSIGFRLGIGRFSVQALKARVQIV
jgi:hypothetical protein